MVWFIPLRKNRSDSACTFSLGDDWRIKQKMSITPGDLMYFFLPHHLLLLALWVSASSHRCWILILSKQLDLPCYEQYLCMIVSSFCYPGGGFCGLCICANVFCSLSIIYALCASDTEYAIFMWKFFMRFNFHSFIQ